MIARGNSGWFADHFDPCTLFVMVENFSVENISVFGPGPHPYFCLVPPVLQHRFKRDDGVSALQAISRTQHCGRAAIVRDEAGVYVLIHRERLPLYPGVNFICRSISEILPCHENNIVFNVSVLDIETILKPFTENKSSLSRNQSLLGHSDRLPRVLGLFGGDCTSSNYGLAQLGRLISKREQQPEEHRQFQKPDDYEIAVGLHSDPIARRFLIAVPGVLLGLGLGFCGWANVDNKWRIFGAALVCDGWLISVADLGFVVAREPPIHSRLAVVRQPEPAQGPVSAQRLSARTLQW
jgi:hypothetical protein